jgi:galactose-1-phosphate uridylyltransferase
VGFLPKGGASQIHPHLQVTINNERYYGNFEIIRNGAEKYYKLTNNNYFTDFIRIHNMLGLSLIHENAVIIFPITPKKEFDVTIISEDYNRSVVELIYAVLKSNFYSSLFILFQIKFHSFSLCLCFKNISIFHVNLLPSIK